MATPFKVLTYEDWLSFAETEGVEEVVQGKIRKMRQTSYSMRILSKI